MQGLTTYDLIKSMLSRRTRPLFNLLINMLDVGYHYARLGTFYALNNPVFNALQRIHVAIDLFYHNFAFLGL